MKLLIALFLVALSINANSETNSPKNQELLQLEKKMDRYKQLQERLKQFEHNLLHSDKSKETVKKIYYLWSDLYAKHKDKTLEYIQNNKSFNFITKSILKKLHTLKNKKDNLSNEIQLLENKIYTLQEI
jgi:hypothetical protein